MDISETYIKMCEKAKEIQVLRPQPNDVSDWDRDYVSHFFLPRENTVEILKWDNDAAYPIIGDFMDDEEGAVWLPRQDQLQEMLDEPLRSRVAYNDVVLGSWEQFLLHIVMREKYSKVWNGEEWIEG